VNSVYVKHEFFMFSSSTRQAASGNPDVFSCSLHFEKMTYDNSQVTHIHPHAWQVTANEFSRTIAEEILDYVAREVPM
jgi:hypothetical protein